MQFLKERVGFRESFYRGEWKGGQRNGYGIQLFPNGARFIGNWKKDSANGFGRLEYINGTFFEGNFKNNKILEGKLQYFSGTVYEGTFSSDNSLFLKGKITFRDKEIFEGEWASNGVILKGCLVTQNGKKMYLGRENLMRKGNDFLATKIIYVRKGVIYEGGFFKDNYDSKGFFYSNFQHPFYFECNYRKGKHHGRYIYHSFYYGFETEEHYFKGKEKGIWKYRTDKGFEYEGNTSTKKQIVKFPFLNQDFFEGELKIWAHSISFVSGCYTMHIKDKKPKLIRVINCEDITQNKEVQRNFYDFEKIQKLITSYREERIRTNFRSKSYTSIPFGDGSQFNGNVINGFLICHIFDLAQLIFTKNEF